METTIEAKVMMNNVKSEFIEEKYLTKEQLTDPDYRLKMLQNIYGKQKSVSCSRCHHCR